MAVLKKFRAKIRRLKTNIPMRLHTGVSCNLFWRRNQTAMTDLTDATSATGGQTETSEQNADMSV